MIQIFHHDLVIPYAPFRYSEPLDTVQQMLDSGITFSPLAGTVMVWLAETDPRAEMKEIRAKQGGYWL